MEVELPKTIAANNVEEKVYYKYKHNNLLPLTKMHIKINK